MLDISMIGMALILGIRHGLDLDHLATIDAITRTVSDRYLARLVGFLFSLGHGLVVTLISLLIGGGLLGAKVPEWLDHFGKGVSLFFLITFGLLNLWTLSSQAAIPTGMKAQLVKKLMKKNNPATIMMIGALFAFSFDTFSQIALFSLSATLMSGWLFSGILGVVFTMGMMITDGCNGLFVSTLIQRADGASLILSRGLGIAITLFSLITALLILIEILM